MMRWLGISWIIFLGWAISLSASDRWVITDPAFGAIADDGKDDADAVQKALEAAIANGGGVVEFPPGVFHVDQLIAVQGDFTRLDILGAGPGLTRFIARSPEGFLRIEATNPQALLQIRDLSVATAVADGGTAFHLTKPYAETDTGGPNLAILHVNLRPEDITAHYFTDGIHADGWSPLIENVNSSGPYGPNVLIADKALPRSVLVLKNAWRPRIRDSHFWAARTGVEIELTDAHSEPTFERSVSVECGVGLRIYTAGRRSLSQPVVIRDSHWNNWEFGLHLSGINGFRLENNIPYFPRGDMEARDYRDIYIEDSSNGVIVNNVFWFTGASPRHCIEIGPGCEAITARQNAFGEGTSQDAFLIDPGARRISIRDNLYGGYYAMDEPGTFGIWEFQNPADPGRSKALLDPALRNDLLVSGAEIRVPDDPDAEANYGLQFSRYEDTAVTRQAWPGTPGLDARLVLRFETNAGDRTVLEVPGVFRLYGQGRDLCLTVVDKQQRAHTVTVPLAAVPGGNRQVRLRVDPRFGQMLLEVDGVGRAATPFPLPLAARTVPMELAPLTGTSAFIGAISHLRVRAEGEQSTAQGANHPSARSARPGLGYAK